jgi:hypothetical protein
MLTRIGISEAARSLGSLADDVAAGHVRVIERRGGPKMVLTSLALQREMLGRCYGFHPEVLSGSAGGVSIWLPELAVYGQGESLDDAESDLVQAVLDYVEDWHDMLQFAPNHAARSGYVLRIDLAESPAQVRQILFPE